MYPEKNGKENILRKAAAAGGLAAAGVVLSFVYIPVGPVKVFPVPACDQCYSRNYPWTAMGRRSCIYYQPYKEHDRYRQPVRISGKHIRRAFRRDLLQKILPCRFKWTAALAEPLGTGIIGALGLRCDNCSRNI